MPGCPLQSWWQYVLPSVKSGRASSQHLTSLIGKKGSVCGVSLVSVSSWGSIEHLFGCSRVTVPPVYELSVRALAHFSIGCYVFLLISVISSGIGN